MSTPIRNVTLSFPCREEWDKFEIVPGGRHCKNCQHVVRDFRDCSMTELQEAMKRSSHVCGVFRKDQLSPTFAKAAALALAVTSATACQEEIELPASNEVTVESVELSADELVEEFVTTGIVFDVPADTTNIEADLEAIVPNEIESSNSYEADTASVQN